MMIKYPNNYKKTLSINVTRQFNQSIRQIIYLFGQFTYK